MKPTSLILLVPGQGRRGNLRRQVLRQLLDQLPQSPQLAGEAQTPLKIEVVEDPDWTQQAANQAWIIASPAAHPQVMEAARSLPERMVLLPDLAAPLTAGQDDFWKEQAGLLAAVAAVSQGERDEIASRWNLDPASVIRMGLGLVGGAAAGRTPDETSDGETEPFQLDLLKRWSEGRVAVTDASSTLRRELCFEADGGIAVPARRMNEAEEFLRHHNSTARQLGLQGRLFVTARHDARASAETLLRLLQALPARRRLRGRRVAIYTPSFLPYDAVSNYVAESCRLLQGWGAEFSLHVQDHLHRKDFQAHLRPVSDPDPEADVEIYHYPGFYPAVGRLKQPSRAVRIFDYHGVTPSSLWPDDSLAQSEKEIALARGADAVFTHSLFSQAFLGQEHGVSRQKMIRFPYSVDLSAFAPRPADTELLAGYGLQGERVLLYVGRMAPNKRIDVLVQGLARLPGDCALVLAGDATHPLYARERDKALEWARRLGVESRVIFTGSVSDPELRRLFHSAHLFVSASLHEGFGIPFIEAMACGLPSLGTQAASIPEVIGQAGRTFAAADPDGFARQALALLEDDAAYLKAVEAGLRQAQLYSRQSLNHNLALALGKAQSGISPSQR